MWLLPLLELLSLFLRLLPGGATRAAAALAVAAAVPAGVVAGAAALVFATVVACHAAREVPADVLIRTQTYALHLLRGTPGDWKTLRPPTNSQDDVLRCLGAQKL